MPGNWPLGHRLYGRPSAEGKLLQATRTNDLMRCSSDARNAYFFHFRLHAHIRKPLNQARSLRVGGACRMRRPLRE
eukprot:4966001-Pyramimonas_sp.AAC.1